MITTLGMLRDSLIERAELERERERAQAEIRAARDAAEAALHELKSAQAKCSFRPRRWRRSGQLTAGIADEIKNPLNFVNNFASLSIGLLDELKAVAAPAFASFDQHQRGQLDEVTELLTGNLERIVEHGKRADNIVKSMLAHSRGGGGDRQNADLNALVEEIAESRLPRRARPGSEFQHCAGSAVHPRHSAGRTRPAGRHARVSEPLRQRILRGERASGGDQTTGRLRPRSQ